MKKPVNRYRGVFVGRWEGAEMEIEARSDRGAARILASYELDRHGWCCDLVDLLKWDGARWVGVPHVLVENASHFVRRAA